MSTGTETAYYAGMHRHDGDLQATFGPSATALEALRIGMTHLGGSTGSAVVAGARLEAAPVSPPVDDMLDYLLVGRTVDGAWDFDYRGPQASLREHAPVPA